jgi:hypothetical protein
MPAMLDTQAAVLTLLLVNQWVYSFNSGISSTLP